MSGDAKRASLDAAGGRTGVVNDYPNRSINGAESGKVVGPDSVLVVPTAKQSDAVAHATDSSEASARPGGFCAAQLDPFHSQACGRAGVL
jgi:hypothetical protein